MAAFQHTFTWQTGDESTRVYQSGDNRLRLDFVSESCVRVAVYREKEPLLPTVNLAGAAQAHAVLPRLTTEPFCLCPPLVQACEGGEVFTLPCGIQMQLAFENGLLRYLKEGELLFADRAPLAYNLAGEFGSGHYHYLTRQPGECIFGLGDKGGALNKAGRAFRIETTDCMGYDAAMSDPLYKHIPFYICENSVGCYGIFYDTAATSYMDFGKEINNYYPPYKYFKTDDNGVVYYVFFGSKLSILQQFGRLCGKQAFPPRWSLQYCASTMAYTEAPDAARQMDGFLEQLEQHNLPCAGFYLSSGYTTIGERRYVFHWDHGKFPDPTAFVKKFQEHGIRIIPNIKPAFLNSHPLYEKIAREGWFVKQADGSPYVGVFWDGLGSYLDFTNPAAFAFWKQQVGDTLLDYGICATWNDNNEFDIKDESARVHGFGEGAAAASRLRPMLTYLMVAASFEAQQKKHPHMRPFLSTRSGGIAVRRLAQTWSGDNRTAFEDLRYCHNIGLTMSLSGLSFYGHDVGGFYGDMPSPELFVRWIQHGIFEPRFVIHSWNADGSATMPWSHPAVFADIRALFAQRQRLLPYFYQCAYRAVEEEIPVNAPPLLYYDDAPLYAQNDSMMVGRDLLVAFVFDEGNTQTQVYLPSGERWYNGANCYAGGQCVNMQIPLQGEMPYFVREGSIIPTQEESIIFTVYAPENGSFESRFFWDDGETDAYRQNRCVKLHFHVVCEENTLTVRYHNTGDMPFTPVVRLREGDRRQLCLEQE